MEIDLDKMLEPLRQKVINKEHLESLWQELAGETGEYRIGKQTLLLIVDAALRSLDDVQQKAPSKPSSYMTPEELQSYGEFMRRRMNGE